jgi:hypothetical protein
MLAEATDCKVYRTRRDLSFRFRKPYEYKPGRIPRHEGAMNILHAGFTNELMSALEVVLLPVLTQESVILQGAVGHE